jgi:hypothetical protein
MKNFNDNNIESNSISFELVKPEQERPFGEIEKFQPWAQSCIKKYLATGNLNQVFQISHAAVIFESLWSLGVVPNDDWLLISGKSALFTLEKINKAQTQEKRSEFEDELLAITLLIREYFIINDCFDPNSGLIEVGKKWKKPEHLPKYYLNQLHRAVESFT